MSIKKKFNAQRRAKAAPRRPAAPPRISAQRYHELLIALTEGVVMLSRSGKVLVANPSAEAILGVPLKEMDRAGRDDAVWRAIDKDGKPFAPREFPIRKTLHSGKPQKNVLVGIRPGGKRTRWTEVNTQPLFERGSRTPAAVVASFEDVTRQRRIEAERARLVAATQASPDAITSTDLDGKLISWNPGAERLFGYNAREALGRSAGWMLPERKREEMRSLRQRVLRGETIAGWETERTREDGQKIYFESSYAPIRDPRGRIIGAVGVHRDVSQMKRMLLQIESSKELLRLALNGIPDVFLIYNHDLRIQFVNERGMAFSRAAAPTSSANATRTCCRAKWRRSCIRRWRGRTPARPRTVRS
jgi:PAS domain S-box-containing protein